MSKTLDFDPDALRENTARSATSACGPRPSPVRRARRRLPPLCRRSATPTPASPASRSPTRSRWRSSAAASPASWPRRGCARPGSRTSASSRGRRLRRHLVLESLSRRAVRHRKLLLPAAAGRDRLHPQGEVLLRQRDLRACPRIGEPSTSTAPASRPSERAALGRT